MQNFGAEINANDAKAIVIRRPQRYLSEKDAGDSTATPAKRKQHRELNRDGIEDNPTHQRSGRSPFPHQEDRFAEANPTRLDYGNDLTFFGTVRNEPSHPSSKYRYSASSFDQMYQDCRRDSVENSDRSWTSSHDDTVMLIPGCFTVTTVSCSSKSRTPKPRERMPTGPEMAKSNRIDLGPVGLMPRTA